MIRLRPATVDEAGLLSSLALRSKAYWGYSTTFVEACATELQVDRHHLTGSLFRCTVAELEQEIAGYYVLEKCSLSEWELDAFFIDPPHIAQGIGCQLIEHAKSTAASLGGSRILIQSDPNAAGFYRKAGGRLLDTRESDSIPGRYLPVFSIDVSEYRRCDL
ncbi:MAG: GNAT family N-acetyltransferase [Cyanobacteria bacterium J06597_1]